MNRLMRWQHVRLRGRRVTRVHGVNLVVDDQGFLPDDLPAHIYDYLAQLPKSWVRRKKGDTDAWDGQIASLKLLKKEAEAVAEARTKEVVAARQEADRIQSKIDALEAKKDIATKVVTTDEDKARAARRNAARDAEKAEIKKVAAEARAAAAARKKAPRKKAAPKKAAPKKAAPMPDSEAVPTEDEVSAALSE